MQNEKGSPSSRADQQLGAATVIRALGFSETYDFKPFRPGRLCRGRERWITPWDLEDPAEAGPELTRLVVTGATFEDDSARDALRGLTPAGVTATQVIEALFPRKNLLVFVEDGHPADIPESAEGIELYEGFRAGGRTQLPLVRWYMKLSDSEALRELADATRQERISGFAVVDDKTDIEALWEKLFLLVGMATLDSPPARYNPGGLPEVLDLAEAVVVLHRDKHGPVVGVYSRDRVDGGKERLAAFAEDVGCLLVPFAIPPMLARWDRALYEMRQTWEEGQEEPFPVPRSETPSHWEARRSRRSKRGQKPQQDAELEAALKVGEE